MKKRPFEPRQLHLPVLAAIAGSTEEKAIKKESLEDEIDAVVSSQLSSWPTLTASEADQAIFQAIAARYFRARSNSK